MPWGRCIPMSLVVIVTDYDGTQSVTGPFRSPRSAQTYADRMQAIDGVYAQVTPLEKP